MSPVDAIRPPKRTKKIPVTVAAEKKQEPVATPAPRPVVAKTQTTATASKQRTIILVVAGIMVLVFIAWAGLLAAGKLGGGAGSSGFSATLGDQLRNLWQTIRTSVFKINTTNQITNSTVNDEQIKNLENSVFPQFNDPTKQ